MYQKKAKTFEEAIEGIPINSPEYRSIKAQFDKMKHVKYQQEKSAQNKHKMALMIIYLVKPSKFLNVSKLTFLRPDQIIEIGKAARSLNEALQKAGLISSTGTTRDNWKD